VTSALITITGVENTSPFSLLVGEFLEEIAFVSIEIIQCVRRRGRLDVTEIENRIERFDEIIRSSRRRVCEARDLPDCDISLTVFLHEILREREHDDAMDFKNPLDRWVLVLLCDNLDKFGSVRDFRLADRQR